MRKLEQKEVKLLLREFKADLKNREQHALSYVGQVVGHYALEANGELQYARAKVDLLRELIEDYHAELFSEQSKEEFENEHSAEEEEEPT